MKKNQLVFLLFLFGIIGLKPSTLISQDTLEVVALTYDSTARDVMVEFPADGNWRKIEMLYSMRCHDLAVGNGNVGCREWDYHCNTVLEVPEKTDSIRRTHPSAIVSNNDDETFYFSNSPTYSYFDRILFTGAILNNAGFSTWTVGSNEDYQMINPSGESTTKAYMLYTQEQLSASGVMPGPIQAIRLHTKEAQTLSFAQVRIGQTMTDNLDPNKPPTDDLDLVHYWNTDTDNLIVFSEDYEWDGTSNILVELSYQSSASGLELEVQAAEGQCIYADQTDHYAVLNGAEYWELDGSKFSEISGEITIDLWTYGDNSLPKNNSIFEASDSENRRQVNVHLPWSDATIYWDCGNDGSNYDRLSKGAFSPDFENRWTHWTFIKHAGEAYLRILKDGTHWATETGKNKLIDIENFILGANRNGGNGYPGFVDNVRIWNKALDQATVQQYLYRDVPDDHPYYENLMAEYNFDSDNITELTDSSPNAVSATSSFPVLSRAYNGNGKRKNFIDPGLVPVMSFVQNATIDMLNTTTVVDSIINPQHRIEYFDVVDNELVSSGSEFVYPGSETTNDGSVEITDLTYYLMSPSRFEILSFITPYGNGLDLGPDGKQFTIDMTDYMPIMKGQRRMTIEGVGRNQEELDIRFRFIEGTPPRDIIDIDQLWPIVGSANIWSGYTFGNIKADAVLEPREYQLDPDADFYKIRSVVTGHGQNGEFTNQSHYIDMDGGFQEFQYNVWKECADNPMYPQGGTWIFDRAGWCPGMESDLHEFFVTDWVPVGSLVTLDYGLINSDPGSADYRVNNQLVTYGPHNFTLDAELTDVIRPSTKYEYDRFNPSCAIPEIEVKNTGRDLITSMTIRYHFNGGNSQEYNWSGSLFSGFSTTMTLPVTNQSFWNGNAEGKFIAEIISVNGSQDDYPDNNIYTSTYVPVFEFQRNFRVEFKPDNKPFNSSYSITNSDGEVVFNRNGFTSGQTYTDILDLPGGCYTFQLDDADDDGLEFWFFPNNGIGTMRFDEMNDDDQLEFVAYQFDPDFGGTVYLDFMVRGTTSTEDIVDEASLISISPNPASDKLSVYWEHPTIKHARIEIYDSSGQKITNLQNVSSGISSEIDVSNYTSGQYLLVVHSGNKVSREWIQIMR